MLRPVKQVRGFIEEQEGASIVEYALLLGLIAVACLVGIRAVGTTFNSFFDSLSTTIQGIVSGL
jgi:Flp pilus assembly pilin Flp